MSEVRVVLGEASGGIAQALARLPGVDLIVTDDLDETAQALADAEVLVSYVWRDDFLAGRLRWIQSISVGVDQFPLDDLAAGGVVLTSARGIHGPQVAEHAFGLLLAMTRGIATSVRRQLERDWTWPRVTELKGMTLGVLGLGVIGEAIAERATAFGMRVVGTKRDPSSYAGIAAAVYGPSDSLRVFTEADVVVVAVPGGPDTEGLVGERELNALDGGWLVNVGRGSVVDTDALVDALLSGAVRGAGLDVFPTEPLPDDSPLWDMDSVVISPHVAGASPHYGGRLAELFATNLVAFAGDGAWVNRVV